MSLTVTTFPASHSFACGTVSIDAAPLPTVSAMGSGCTSVLQGHLQLLRRDRRAPIEVLVPVSVSGTATLSATGAAQAGYSLGVGNQTIGIANRYFASLASCGTHSASTSLMMMTNQLYAVGMMADGSNFLGAGIASAVVDPQFFFEGDFGQDFAFVSSPGVGNGAVTGAVPERETLALMLAGLAASSIALRRRRNAGV